MKWARGKYLRYADHGMVVGIGATFRKPKRGRNDSPPGAKT